jgi:hypothetical protein
MLSTLFSLLAATAAATPPAPLLATQLKISPCDVGERYQFERATCSIELRNPGDKAIRITKAAGRLPEDSIQPGSFVVPPNGVAYAEATVDLGNKEGVVAHLFRFTVEGPTETSRDSRVNAYVQSVLDQSQPKFDFGVVRTDTASWPVTKSITLSSREVSDLRVTGVQSKPAWLDVSVDSDGRTLHASLKKDAPWGFTHNGSAYVKLDLNSPKQPHAWIEVEANVLGEVAPDSNPYQLGMMRNVGKHEFLVRLTNRAGKDFKLGKMTLIDIKGKVDAKACIPAASGCRLIRVNVSNDQPLGKLPGVLEIDLPEYGRKLSVELFGALLSVDTKIHDLNELTPAVGAQSTMAPAGPNIGSALANAVKSEAAPPPGNGPLIRWSVAHQTSIYGYVIYRGDSEDGPMVRLNKEIIAASKDGADVSGSYQWRDNTAESGRTYWYQVGTLNRVGAKADLTGKQKVVAK